MNVNKEAFKSEYVFCMYDDILRTHIPSLTKKLISLKPLYENFIKYDAIENVPITNILRLALIRTSYNLLIHLSKTPFEYDLTYMNVLKGMTNIYDNSPNMVMTNTIDILADTSFIKKIFIYSPRKSTAIEDDVITNILNSSNRSNIEFVYGTIEDVVKEINKITLYIVNDIYVANTIMDTLPNAHADILVADYGYNYKLNKKKQAILKIDDIDKKIESSGYGLNMFIPFYKEQLKQA